MANTSLLNTAYGQGLNAPWQQLQNVGAALQYTNPLGNLQGTGKGVQVTDSGDKGDWDPLTMQRAKPVEQSQYEQWMNKWSNDQRNPYRQDPYNQQIYGNQDLGWT